MNRKRIFCLGLALAGIGIAQAQQPDWENEQVFGINKEATHVDYTPYGDLAQALKDEAPGSPYYSTLNGPWKFNWVKQPSERPLDFFRTDFDDADRKESAAFGRYDRTVTEMLEPYERPQGMANREDTRWVRLTDKEDMGILIVARGKLSFTALHFTDQDLWKAAHLYQLHPRKETILSLDYAQMGIGNASCGPTPLPQYYIPDSPAGISFSIRPYQTHP